jgi:NAD(P)-dependent dehydrogenase (short-subunit alcohol dehydrogenase family)
MEAMDRKIALITGANRGIGFVTALGLGRLGMTVLVGARGAEKAEATAALLHREGIAAEPLALDITSPEDIDAAHGLIERRHGQLDVLVNNAGVWLDSADAGVTPPHGSCSVPMEALRRTFDVNFFGTVQVTMRLLPLIRRAPAGRIVNVSSIHGSLALHADPTSPIYPYKALAYGAAKSALNAFTIQLAHDLAGTNVKVNSIHPGWVRTEMGSAKADLEIHEGSESSVMFATLPPDGPTGGFFHLDKALPW